MPISMSKKEMILDSLMESKRKGQKLEISLRIKGKNDEADAAKKKTRILSRKIDDLLAELMKDWLSSAAAIEKEIKECNTKLQGAIRDIKKSIKIAENVVKATGYLDDAIKIAAKLLASAA